MVNEKETYGDSDATLDDNLADETVRYRTQSGFFRVSSLAAARDIIIRKEIQRAWYGDWSAAVLLQKIETGELDQSPSPPEGPSLQTIDYYKTRGMSLLRRYLRQKKYIMNTVQPCDSLFDLVDPMSYARWVADLIPSISAATWRLYKQSILWTLPDGDDWQEATHYISNTSSDCAIRIRRGRAKARSQQAKTSAKRSIQVTPQDLIAILQEAERRARRPISERRSSAAMLIDWLAAGLTTGLRPCEWRQANLYFPDLNLYWPHPQNDCCGDKPTTKMGTSSGDGEIAHLDNDWLKVAGKVVLVVYNMKNSNGRGNGNTRVIDLSQTSTLLVGAIARLIQSTAGNDNDLWASNYSKVASLLYRIQTHLWPKRLDRIQLYSSRHEVLSSWKTVIDTLDVAVLAGHGAVDGPDRHYARSSGRGRFNVRLQKLEQQLVKCPPQLTSLVRTLFTQSPPTANDEEKHRLVQRDLTGPQRLNSKARLSELEQRTLPKRRKNNVPRSL